MTRALHFGWLLVAAVLAAVAGATPSEATPVSAGTAQRVPDKPRIRDYGDRLLKKIVPGRTTRDDVVATLGRPWRETTLDAKNAPYRGDPSVDVWEYRGRDPRGTYRVHVEFDVRGVTTLIAKIPDRAGRAVARVADRPTNEDTR